MRRFLTRVVFPVAAVAAFAVGLAAPAQAAISELSITTLSSGPCVLEQKVQAGYSEENPGKLGFAFPQTRLAFGIPINCAATVTVNWHNETTGASGSHATNISVLNGCDIQICSAFSVPTGSGRVAVELSSNFPHQRGEAIIDVP